MLHAYLVGNPLLELLNERTSVRQPARVEDPVKPFDQPGPIADIRPADMNLAGKSRGASQDGQLAFQIA